MALITDFSQYEIRKLDGFILTFQGNRVSGYYELSKFGLYDVARKSFVSLGSRCKHSGIALPTHYKAKIWREIMQGGIHDDRALGFDLVPESALTKMG